MRPSLAVVTALACVDLDTHKSSMRFRFVSYTMASALPTKANHAWTPESAISADTPAATIMARDVGGTAISSLAGGSGVGGTTCTVTAYGDVAASASACSNVLLSAMTVPASRTLSVTVPSGGALLFAGTMTVEYTPCASHTPIVLEGSNAKVAGLAGAVIDGLGAQYWDNGGSNSGSNKPDHFIKLSDMQSSTVEQLTIRNWPTHLFSIAGCRGVTMRHLLLDNRDAHALDAHGAVLGHNTDAFDVSATDGLTVTDVTVYNQDDCVAVNSGSNMVFSNLYCQGGHGLSIGSVKSDVTVSNITFQHSSVIESENGCRIKTTVDGAGSTVSGITYHNIYLEGITKYAIDVQQDYRNSGPTGRPTSGVTVTGVAFDIIVGSVADSSYAYYIFCGSSSSCRQFSYAGIDLSGGKTRCWPNKALCPMSTSSDKMRRRWWNM